MFQRKRINIAVLTVLGSALAGGAQAQTEAPQKIERVEVTGSSFVKRIDAESGLPMTVISRAEIARTGVTSAQDLVNLIPANFGGGVVANNVGATGGASTANLRALGSKYTLVLLNGRRVANFAFGNSPVDLNSIPLSAVERVEVLRDGASAIYGADAVAGVINFILKKDYQGAEVSAGQTSSDQGGGNTSNINFVGGFGDLNKDKFNVMLSASREDTTALKATQRDFANTAVRPDLGLDKSSPRNGVPNLNFTDTLGNSYRGVNPYSYKGCDSAEFALTVRPGTACGTDYVKFIDLIPEQTRSNFVARGVYQPNLDNQIYAEAMHTSDKVTSVYSPSPYTKTMTYPATGRFYPKSITLPKGMTLAKGYVMPNGSVLAADTVLAADMAVTPQGDMGGTWRTVAGGGRSDITETENDRYVLGAKGLMFGWDYDTAFTYSRNKGEISYGPGKFSYAKLTPLLASGEVNVFGSQDAKSLAALNSALILGTQQTAESISKEVDFKISREIYQMTHGAVGLAFGASYRDESLAQVSFPILASGDEVGGSGPIPSVTGDRKVYGLYSEIVVPVLKELELNFAGRYDNYKNGFGTGFNNFSPKASFRYQPGKEMLFRGSIAQGFRAPTLYENLRPLTTGNNTNGNFSDPIRCPNGVAIKDTVNPVDADTECNVQMPTGTSGYANLKPEKSTQFSLGMAFTLSDNLNTTFDYWNVDIKDPIVTKSEQQVFGDPAKYLDYYYRYDPKKDPDQANPIKGSSNKDFPLAYAYLPIENTAKTYASGLDVSAQYRFKTAELGLFGASIDGTYFLTHGYQYTGLAKVSDLGKYKDFGPAPKWRHALSFTWLKGPFAVSLTNNYTMGYEDFTDPLAIGPDYPLVRNVSNYSTWDTQFNLRPTKSLEFTAGIKNLLNQDPPVSRTTQGFQTGYDATFANPIGRQYYGRVKYSFF
ncbi:TonB-dependent receptor [Paucibacter sp. B2R-40]|uniref:TonB-dependent receptor plug domain-containing protein n=1 Tax=Paucibacter sp. B2R-40 TaxID=2893554 RepID=UPI0021E4BD21|nr:TonB-dependent receptor [Paucibacter sp. B2R-40]MCV2354167.1 TonB-dependent receptor [Paucibacter sp. B2R-40]